MMNPESPSSAITGTLLDRTEATDGICADSISEVWAELRRHLELRGGELNAEVRSYPSPIARCDDQLPKLLEQRSRVFRELKRVVELGPMPDSDAQGDWLERIDEFLCLPDAATDEDTEAAIRARARSALSDLRRRVQE